MNETRRRMPTIAAVVLGVIIVVLVVLIASRQLAVAGMTRDITQQKEILADYKRELSDSSTWKKDYSSLCLRLGGRMQACSWSDQMPFAVAQLSGIVESHGLKIESMQPQPMTMDKPVERFPLRVGLQSDLNTLTAVLEDIEKTVPLLEVERLDIRNSHTKEGLLQADMTVSSYVVIDKDAPKTVKRTLQKPEKAEKPVKEAAQPQEKKETGKAQPQAAPAPSKPVQVTPQMPAVRTQNAVQNGKNQTNKLDKDEMKRLRKLRKQQKQNGNAAPTTAPATPGQPVMPNGAQPQPQPQGGAR